MGGVFFEKLGAMSWPTQIAPFARVRCATLLAQMLSPVECIKDGKACMIKDADLAKLTNKKNLAEVEKCEAMLDKAREWMEKFGIQGRSRLLMLADHDCRIANYLMKKGSVSRENVEYPDAASACQVLVNSIAKATNTVLDNPWAPGSRVHGKQPLKAHGCSGTKQPSPN